MLSAEMWGLFSYSQTRPNILQNPDKIRMQGAESVTPQKLCRTFRITQLQRSSLHIEKHLVSQRIQECMMTLEALEDRMQEIEEGIVHSTHTVGSIHSFMDQVGVPIPDMSEQVASSILFSEVSHSFFHISKLLSVINRMAEMAGIHGSMRRKTGPCQDDVPRSSSCVSCVSSILVHRRLIFL